MSANTTLRRELETEGRVWLRGTLDSDDLAAFDEAVKDQTRPGARLAQSEWLSQVLAPEGSLQRAIDRVASGMFPVRTVAFNKSSQTNWCVPWHQDRVIAVRAKCDLDGHPPRR